MFPAPNHSKLTENDMQALRYSIQMIHELMADLLNSKNWETDYAVCDEIRKNLLEILKNVELKKEAPK